MSYGAIGMPASEGPNLYSMGYYKVPTTKVARISCPLSISGASFGYDTNDQNKVSVELYTDANHVKPALGISLRNLDAYAAIGEGMRYAGTGPYARDITIQVMGPAGMIFVSGSSRSKTIAGMPIAPDASGFCEWVPGMFLLGKVIEPGVSTGMMCKVFIDAVHAPDVVIFREHLVSPAGNTGTLTYVPLYVRSVDVDTGTCTGGSLVSYLKAPVAARNCLVTKSTKLVTFLAADAVTGAWVEYEVDVHAMTGV